MKMKDLTGLVFGILTVQWPVGYNKRHQIKWLCSCSCGRLLITESRYLVAGRITDCGCVVKSHHMSYTSEYKAYSDARSRCNNPRNGRYPDYGGRGIKFLFKSFEEFFKELGPKPTPQHSVDRINNDGNYEAGNVRWATRIEQRNNCRNFPRVELPLEAIRKAYFDQGLRLSDIGKLYHCSWTTIRNRLRKMGYPLRPRGAYYKNIVLTKLAA